MNTYVDCLVAISVPEPALPSQMQSYSDDVSIQPQVFDYGLSSLSSVKFEMQKEQIVSMITRPLYSNNTLIIYPTSISPPGITVYLPTISLPRSDLTLNDEFSPGAKIMNFAFSVEAVINVPLLS